MLKDLIARKVSAFNLVPGTKYIGIPKEKLPYVMNLHPFMGTFELYFPELPGKGQDKLMRFVDGVFESFGELTSVRTTLSISPPDQGSQSFYNFYTVKKLRTNEEEKLLKNQAKTRKNQTMGELKAIPNFGSNYQNALERAKTRGYANKTRKTRRSNKD